MNTKPQGIYGFTGQHRWLSNFVPCVVFLDGDEYKSVEAAYQAAKFPHSKRSPFLNAQPGAAKRMGNQLRMSPLEKRSWEERRVRVMRELLVQKFVHTAHYRTLLLATGDLYIEETNHWGDTFWGVCSRTGKGQNTLGKLIMDIREELQ